MSLYAQYITERLNKQIIEDSEGFAVYYFENDYVYLEDIYVIPEKRKTKKASEMADKIASIAKKAGYNKMLGSVVPTANNSTTSLKVLMGYGFSLLAAQDNIIYFIKEI